MKCKGLLSGLRTQLAKHKLSAYYVPSTDPHNSEYTPACYKRVAAVSGFTGSAGSVVVTPEKALLWTDGRYFVQAGTELDGDWELMKLAVTGYPTLAKWCSEMAEGSRFGYDPHVVTVAQHDRLAKAAKKIEFVPIPENLLDVNWTNRPAHPCTTIFNHPESFTGRPSQDKIKAVVENLTKNEATSVVISALDEIAWLFNLRADDIECTPVFFSYAMVSNDGKAVLFTDLKRFPEPARTEIKPFTEFLEYDSVTKVLKERCKGKVLYDENTTSMAVFEVLKAVCEPVHDQSCVAVMKAVKNPVEAEGFKACHVRDGVALSRYLMWLEKEIGEGRKVTECTGADKLAWFRGQGENFVSLSFATISSSGPNAAIIHYKPNPETCRDIIKDDLYLVDSGGQYKDGTTDVTRTICFGNPRPEEVEAFTLVLKGVISLNSMVFPAETTGHRLDASARQALWRYGLNFCHGTGHGVGHFLGVHEGPIGVSSRSSPNEKALSEGNVLSNEPGFYKDGVMGIRIENLELVVKAETKYRFNDTQFLTMETLTMCPYDTRLIDTSLLTEDEVQWVNAYHAKVQKTLTAASPDTELHKWLAVKCAPITRGDEGGPAKKRKL